METPLEALGDTFSGASFGAIFAVNTANTFILMKSQGDMFTVLLLLGLVGITVFVGILSLYQYMAATSDEKYQVHRTFVASMYLFLKTVFKWVVMLAFSVFTQWLPVAFLNEPHIVNYLLFILLVFFSLTFAIVVNGLVSTDKPLPKKNM